MEHYGVLKGKMKENGVAPKHIATAISKRYETVLKKLNGDTDFTVAEARIIIRAFFPDLSMEELFTKSEVKYKGETAIL